MRKVDGLQGYLERKFQGFMWSKYQRRKVDDREEREDDNLVFGQMHFNIPSLPDDVFSFIFLI